MPILNENTDHQFFCTGESMTEPEHAERCSIPYQLERMSRGLPPNWGNKEIQYGYDKMDNSLTDHRIELEKAATAALESDLTAISDEDFALLSPTTKSILFHEREKQKSTKLRKKQNDEKLKNDEQKSAAPTSSSGSTLTDEKPAAASGNTNSPKS